ncbi:MAG TPA: DUF1254 domain-containing protein [Kofleriaceae bacterium]|nr:DUF1254 domain-containing protein [Kofleriaceae bacterium]
MEVTISSNRRALDLDYPAQASIRGLHEDQRLLSAVQAYRFFYPSVSVEAIFHGNREAGIEDGKALVLLAAGPRHLIFTANSDTPYACAALDLAMMGPVVIDLPRGPYIGLVDDHHHRWVVDLGIPGRDAGHGGRYLIVPPGYFGELPDGHHIAYSSTHKALLALRALPHDGDLEAAKAALREVRVFSLAVPEVVLPYVDISTRPIDGTPLRWETSIEYWHRLDAIIQEEPLIDEYRPMYGALAAIGITKGHPFEPDPRTRDILEAAASIGLDQMRVEGFASDRLDRIVWDDRRWEWVGLVPDDPNFETKNFLDLQARDRWFFQAICTSPAMFRRHVGTGSVYWLASRDATGAYLDGGRPYKLTVPHPVPASMFWSVTAYDAKTRSQVVTPQDRAVLSSLVDPLVPDADGHVDLYFGPSPPSGRERQWIQTTPGGGFFLYFRIYGPESEALDGTWRLGDLEPLR